ncbi:unnamed protein product, partial [marine sediment metagenome]
RNAGRRLASQVKIAISITMCLLSNFHFAGGLPVNVTESEGQPREGIGYPGYRDVIHPGLCLYKSPASN